MSRLSKVLALQCLISWSSGLVHNPTGFVGTYLPLPSGFPGLLPSYMRDNVNNEFGTAPDGGLFNGPVLGPLSESVLKNISAGPVFQNLTNQAVPVAVSNGTSVITNGTGYLSKRQPGHFTDEEYEQSHRYLDNVVSSARKLPRQSSDSYWLDNVAHGANPLAPSNYTFFRNVMHYGAKGDGKTDDTAAINMAVSDGNRCGNNCGSTSVLGAVVYFPPGTYVVSSPIIQYYYTQFVGDPSNMPTLQSTYNFTGIAIVDSDVYIPGGNGAEWYLNQNNFYRTVQNINFDLTQQAPQNMQNYQTYYPTGIHWQVGQATSITNCNFKMAVSSSSDPDGRATSVGIFMENGSGGFMSDLTFYGGNAGIVAGSQQFTFRNMQFTSCLQAVSMLWNWGMTFQNIYIDSVYIGFNCTSHGGITGQGTGSLSIIDSHFNHVPQGILLPTYGTQPNLILDNLLVESSDSIVFTDGVGSVLDGSSNGQITITSWGMGGAYLDTDGTRTVLKGYINPPPNKPSNLLGSDGRYFTQSKPLYANIAGGDVVVATAHGVSNDMTGDQSGPINSLLSQNIGKLIFFPAGIYLVEDTVFVPKGSMIVGEGWSQIMATGSKFANANSPHVMVRVGNAGDTGDIQIQNMLFTVKGDTAGCVLMEWNIAESSQGSAAMWDSHFRVGGAAGTDLQLGQCQGAGPNACNAASLLMHLTESSSGYFENVWAWVADHDLDNPDNAFAYETQAGVPQNVETDINVYAGRGILIESQGPVWFWASSSEHSELYNYQINNASNVFMSIMQTETPYYQPEQNALTLAYTPGTGGFNEDPTFSDCSAANCVSSWALRMLNSSNILVYSAGFYSFFDNHQLGCGNQQDCQERIVQSDYVGDLFFYNLFTYGAEELVSPAGGYPPPIFFNDSNQDGYTSEVAAWLALSSSSDGEIGGGDDGDSGIGSGVVYIDPSIWVEPAASQTVGCLPPCTFVLPPITLSTTTTISFPLWTTTLEVGWTTTTTSSGSGTIITSAFYTSISESTVLTIPPVTTTLIPIWNTVIPGNVTSTIIYPTSSILPPPIIITDNPNPLSSSGVSHTKQTRTIYPPPFPWQTSSNSHDTHLPTLTYHSSKPTPTCISGCGSKCHFWCHPCNPILPPFLGGCTGSDFCTDFCPPGTGPGNDGTSDPNDPNNDDGDDDDDCTTTTTSDCRTICIASSTCSTTCTTYEGCEVEASTIDSTETPADAWTGTLPDSWVAVPSSANSPGAAEASVYSALLSKGLVKTSAPYVTTQPSRGTPPLPSSTTTTPKSTPQPTVSTIYVTKTTVYTTTVVEPTYEGALTMAAYSAYVGDGRGPARDVFGYDLNFISARETSFDVCSAGNFYVFGPGTPTQNAKTWSTLPNQVSFVTALTSGPSPISSCVYTNTAASNSGDGGTVQCKGTNFPCVIATETVLGCNADALIGYDTYIKLLVHCDWYGPTTVVKTETLRSLSARTTTIGQ